MVEPFPLIEISGPPRERGQQVRAGVAVGDDDVALLLDQQAFDRERTGMQRNFG